MQPSYRRLESVLRGVDGGRRHSPHNEPAAAVAAPSLADPAMDSRPAKLLSDRDVQEFIRSGWMSLGPEEIGLPPAQVEQIHRDGCRWFDNARDEIADPATGVVHPLSSDNLLSEMPGLQDVCRSPAVHGALRSLLGEGYVLHPHGGFHAKPPGSVGQSFHKDGFFPGGGHGIRYHRPEYLLFFYYPQDTTELRGEKKCLLGTILMLNMIILPRQAPGKHRKSGGKKAFVCRPHGDLAAVAVPLERQPHVPVTPAADIRQPRSLRAGQLRHCRARS
jgi:hypothetical protein